MKERLLPGEFPGEFHRPPRSPLERIKIGAIVLVVILVVAVIGYVWAGYGWVEAVWMVVITISSVGYGERAELSPGMQLFTIAVILLGMSAAAYTMGGLITLTLEGELERFLGSRRMTMDINKMKGHVIVCGFGRMGHLLAEELSGQNQPFVIIDKDPNRIDEAQASNYLCLRGDATVDEVLRASGLERASALVTALPTDAANVFITLTARDINAEIQIIARAEYQTSERKLCQAGANRVVTPAITGARQMIRMITRPATAELIELVAENSMLEVELDELSLGQDGALIGVSLEEAEAHRRHGLLVVAVKSSGNEIMLNPEAKYQFQAHDVVIVMGRADDIAGFRQRFQL